MWEIIKIAIKIFLVIIVVLSPLIILSITELAYDRKNKVKEGKIEIVKEFMDIRNELITLTSDGFDSEERLIKIDNIAFERIKRSLK